MFKTKASMRRYILGQFSITPNAPESLQDRYRIYVECVGFTEYPKSFKEWLSC